MWISGDRGGACGTRVGVKLGDGKLTVDSVLPGDAPCWLRLQSGRTELHRLGSAPLPVVARPLAPHHGRALVGPGVVAGQHAPRPHPQVSDRPALLWGRWNDLGMTGMQAGMQASLLPTPSR